MGLDSIDWDRIFHTTPIYDFEFDLHRIRTLMCDSQLLITKALCYGPSVDFMVKLENDDFVASLRCCEPEITNFQIALAPCYFEINNADASTLNIVVRQKNKAVAFTCKFMLLRWNTIIG